MNSRKLSSGITIDNCKICGMVCQQQPSHDGLCDGCWECVSRLEDVLQHPAGRKIIARAYARHLRVK